MTKKKPDINLRALIAKNMSSNCGHHLLRVYKAKNWTI